MTGSYELHLIAADGSTITTCGSWPGHVRPFLEVKDVGASRVDFLDGSSKIGQVGMRILDRRRVESDQTTGWFTELLGLHRGLNGVRGRVLYYTSEVAYRVVVDGPVSTPDLESSYVAYSLVARDENERARQTRAFDRSGTCTLLRRGVLTGYGLLLDSESRAGGATSRWLSPPTVPLVGVVRASPGGGREVFVGGLWDRFRRGDGDSRVPADLILTPRLAEFRNCLYTGGGYVYENVALHWRFDSLVGGDWTVLDRDQQVQATAPPESLFAHQNATPPGAVRVYGIPSARTVGIYAVRLRGPVALLPAVGAQVQLHVVYTGPASEEFPLHYEGTVGDFLVRCYRGDFSRTPQPSRYDEAALLARFPERVRARLTEPVSDLRSFLEREVFQVLSAAPTLDADARISPRRTGRPDTDTPVVALFDESNTVASADWRHGDASVCNVYQFTYYRDCYVDPEDDPLGERSAADRIAARQITIETRGAAESFARFGDKPRKVTTSLFRSLGGADGEPLTGEYADEIGHQIGRAQGASVVERFQFGAQEYSLDFSRAAYPNLLQGDYVLTQVGWLPNYATGRRGMNRLGQVTSLRQTSPVLVQAGILDMGDDVQPLADPVAADGVAEDVDGSVAIATSQVLAGATLAVRYAVATTGASAYPTEASGLWSPLDGLRTPVLPAGVRVWFQFRWEAPRRRPSRWVNAGTLLTSSTARIMRAGLNLAHETGTAEVFVEANRHTTVIVVRYAVHPEDEAPVYTDVGVLIEDFPFTLPTVVPQGYAVTVELVPYHNGVAGTARGGLSEVRQATLFTSFGQEELSNGTRRVTLTATPEGATIHYRLGAGAFVEAPSPVSFELTVAGSTVLEYYATFAGQTEAPTKRVTLDPGTAGQVERLVPAEPSPGVIRVDAITDDDVVSGEWYARMGTPPVDAVGNPDPMYFKTRNRFYWSSRVDLGTWHVVFVGMDRNQQTVTASTSFTVRGGTAETIAPSIGPVGVTLVADAGGFAHEVRWEHNATVDAGGYFVEVLVNGAAAGAQRDARRDPGGSLPGTAGFGGVLLPAPQPASPGAANAALQTFNFEVRLLDAGGVYTGRSAAASLSGWYTTAPSSPPEGIPPAPLLSPLGGGDVEMFWSATEPWPVRVQWWRNGVLHHTTLLPAGTDMDTLTVAIGSTMAGRYQHYNASGDGPWSPYSPDLFISGAA